MAILHINALTIARGSRPIVQDLTWRLGRGEIGLVSGRNGSGKTTLLRCLAGLLPCADGGFTINGSNGQDNTYYIGHRNGLLGDLSLLGNMRFHASLLGVNGGADACLAALGRLGDDWLAEGEARLLSPAQLSAGQQKRVALARLGLICHQPQRLWLLDEPYSGLDREGSARLTALIAEYCATGGSVVISSHTAFKFAKNIKTRQLALAA